MNFYSLDGSKIDSNNLFENRQIFERFDNTPMGMPMGMPMDMNDSTLDNVVADENEEFASVPTTKSKATDNNFQCSDGYEVEGSNLGNQYTNTNLTDCKKMCSSMGADCIGFNFDTKNNTCTLKKNASSMLNTSKSSTLCIKKSAGNTNCNNNKNQTKSNTQTNSDSSIKAFNELDSIFNEQKSANLNKPNLPNIPNQPNQPNLPNLQNMQNQPNQPNQANLPNLQNMQNQPNQPNLQNLQNMQNQPNQQNLQNQPNQQNLQNMQNQQNQQNQRNLQTPNNIVGPNSMMESLQLASNDESKYPMKIPTIEKPRNLLSNSQIETETETETKTEKNNNMVNNQSGVFVDLNCFMKNINVLQNHTDNMMIDMSLLLSNIKMCSYVKKTLPDTNSPNKNMGLTGLTGLTSPTDSKVLLEKINSRLNIPEPETIKLKNIKADVVVTSGINSPSQVLKVSKEPNQNFSQMLESYDSLNSYSNENHNYFQYKNMLFVIIIIVILCLLIFKK